MKRRGNGEGSICQSNGYWVAQITLPSGKRKKKYAKSQKDAKEWLLAQRNAIRDAVWTDQDSVTLSEFLDRYMADVASHTLRPNTYQIYAYMIRVYIKPVIGAVKLSALSPAQVQHLYTLKLSSGLSRRSVQFIHAILHKAMKQALRWGLVTRNVCDLVDPPTVKHKDPVTWSLEEVKKFLSAVRGSRFEPIYVLALATGMRIGELLGIQVEDIDWKNETIHVRHAVIALAGHGMVLTEPKTDQSKRSIKMPKFAVKILSEYVEQNSIQSGYLFSTKTGKPFSPRNIVRHFKSVLRAAGLPNIRFHDLRHTCATLHLTAGTHPKMVQELLGHSTITLTLNTYSHVLPTIQDEAAQRMNNLLG